MNRARDLERHPEGAVHHSALNAMGLIDVALHAVVGQYRQQRDPQVMMDALGWFASRLGRKNVDLVLQTFAEHFPTVAVYRGRQTAAEWLAASTDGVPHRAIALEE